MALDDPHKRNKPNHKKNKPNHKRNKPNQPIEELPQNPDPVVNTRLTGELPPKPIGDDPVVNAHLTF